MNETEARRLIQAARTAVSLIGLVHQSMWELYPNETLLLMENEENQILEAFCAALRSLPEPHLDLDLPNQADFLGRVAPDSMSRPPDAVWSGNPDSDGEVDF